MRGIPAAVLGVAFVAAAFAQGPAGYPLREFGTTPRPAPKDALLDMPAIRAELGLTTAQIRAIEGTRARFDAEELEELREITDRARRLAIRRAAGQSRMAAILANLDPHQRDRLDQIQLQIQGPSAFGADRPPPLDLEGPSLTERLGLDDGQVAEARAIAEGGESEIEAGAILPVTPDPRDPMPTLDSIRQAVDTPRFRAAKGDARALARKSWDLAVGRIERSLSDPQRRAYRAMLGAPFDLAKLRTSEGELAADLEGMAIALGASVPDLGQRADPNYDTRVARPAYVGTHPRVLFDEAHDNFHTTDGLYKPFVRLIAHDGYRVDPNRDPLDLARLSGADILVIANALGAEGMNAPGAADPAFTEAECDAVRDWVRAGGSLLLITDLPPFGSAAAGLAARFGVETSRGLASDPVHSEGGPASLVFSRGNGLLGDHPITDGRDASERIGRVQTFAGQSLKGPAGSVAILKLGDSAVDDGPEGRSVPAAGRSQGVAFAFGRGRVVVLGEAGELSAQSFNNRDFGMNVPGLDNRQMALNIMHWLSGLLEPR